MISHLNSGQIPQSHITLWIKMVDALLDPVKVFESTVSVTQKSKPSWTLK